MLWAHSICRQLSLGALLLSLSAANALAQSDVVPNIVANIPPTSTCVAFNLNGVCIAPIRSPVTIIQPNKTQTPQQPISARNARAVERLTIPAERLVNLCLASIKNKACIQHTTTSTHKKPLEYANTTHKKPFEYANATHKKPLEYVNTTHKKPFESVNTTHKKPFEYVNTTHKKPLEYVNTTHKKPPEDHEKVDLLDLPPTALSHPSPPLFSVFSSPHSSVFNNIPLISNFFIPSELSTNTALTDYGLPYAGYARYNWAGQNYANRKTAYSMPGWNAGMYYERDNIFTSARIGHYRENTSYSYAPGQLRLYRFDGSGSYLNIDTTSFDSSNLVNFYEGVIGFRMPLNHEFIANVGGFIRLGDGDFSVITTDTATTAPVNGTSRLTETLDSFYLGPRLGFTTLRYLAPDWTLRGSFGLSTVLATQNYTYSQSFSDGFIRTSANATSWGIIADSKFGIEYDTGGPISLNFGGYGNYVSNAPAIDRPDNNDATAVKINTMYSYELGLNIGLHVKF